MKASSFLVEKHMTHYPTLTTAETSVKKALKMMKEGNFRHLPVLDGQQIVGIVSQRDLLMLQSVLEKSDPPVSKVMTPQPYIVRVGVPLAEVTRKMAEHKYGSAIVVNDKTGIVGIFTTIDGMRLLSTLLEGNKAQTQEWEEAAIEKYFEWSRDSECLD